MTSRIQHIRKHTPGDTPVRSDGPPGALAVNLPDRQLYVRDSADFQELIAVRVFAESAAYYDGDLALTPRGVIQRALRDIAPGPYDATAWDDHSAVSGALMAKNNFNDVTDVDEAVANLGLDDAARLSDIADVVRVTDIEDIVRLPDISDVLRTADIYNGPDGVIALDSSGKLPSVDGSQLTNLPAQSVVFRQGGSGAIDRPIQDKAREIINVKDFGAVGDGVHDDAPHFQDAINYAAGRFIYAPAGTFRLDNGLVWDTTNKGIADGLKIIGAGKRATIFDNRSSGALITCTSGSLHADYQEGVHFAHFGITSTNNAPSTTGILLSGVRTGLIDNVVVDGQKLYGVHLHSMVGDATDNVHIDIDHSEFFNCGSTGVYAQGELLGVNAGITISQCRFISCDYGVVFRSMQAGIVESCAFAQNRVYGLLLDDGTAYSKSCVVRNNEFDTNGSVQIMVGNVENTVISGNYFTLNGGVVVANIDITARALNVLIDGSMPRAPAPITGLSMFRLSASARDVVIAHTDWSAWSSSNTKYAGSGPGYTIIDTGAYLTPLSVNAGIKFPTIYAKSADPNTLDDYRQGTWTTTISAHSGFSADPVLTLAKYVKIGKQVTLEGTFSGNVVAQGRVDIRFSLPFPTEPNLSSACGSAFEENTATVGAVVDNSSATADVAWLAMNSVVAGARVFRFSYTYISG